MMQCIWRIRKIKGFNGTGFRAKEILLDLKRILDEVGMTNFFVDYECWSPVGPGARKGLNRIFRTNSNISTTEETYFKMMQVVHNHILKVKYCIPPDMKFTIHDTQFVLCEFNKYMRISNKERGYYRKYKVFIFIHIISHIIISICTNYMMF